MYSVPPGDFHETIKGHERQIHGRVMIDYTDPFKDEGVTAAASESLDPAFLPQITDGKDQPAAKWASLDGAWELDGSWAIAPAEPTMQVGWWSDSLAGAVDGSFAAPPVLTLAFAAPQVIDQLTVTGDSLREEYPADFTIRLYDQDSTLLLEREVTGNAEVAWAESIEPAPISGVAIMELEIARWSHPGRQAKIVEFYTALQEVYEGDGLISIQLLEEREVSGGSLPIGNISANEIEIRLNNLDRRFSAGNENSPLYGMLRANRRIRAWLGIDTYVEYRGGSE